MTAWPEGEGEGRGANNVISNTWYLIPHWPSVVYRGISTSVHHYIRQFTCQLTTLSVSLSVTWLFYLSLDHFIRHLTTYSYFLCPFLHICRQLFALKKWSSPFYLSCTWTMGDFQIFLEDFQIFGRYSGFRKIFRFLAKSQKLELWFARCKCETQKTLTMSISHINATNVIFPCRQFEETFENAQRREVKHMQPMWLCIFSGRQFEETFENTQWRKVKQMQTMPLCLISRKPFEETFENAHWGKIKQIQPMWICFISCRQFEDTFENAQKRKDK